MTRRRSAPELSLRVQFNDDVERRKLPPFVEELRFHPTRRWRFDFAFLEQRLAVEIEGGIWTGGAHTRGKHFTSDCEKYAEALLLGWSVLRVPADWVHDGTALAFVRRWFESRQA